MERVGGGEGLPAIDSETAGGLTLRRPHHPPREHQKGRRRSDRRIGSGLHDDGRRQGETQGLHPLGSQTCQRRSPPLRKIVSSLPGSVAVAEFLTDDTLWFQV